MLILPPPVVQNRVLPKIRGFLRGADQRPQLLSYQSCAFVYNARQHGATKRKFVVSWTVCVKLKRKFGVLFVFENFGRN